MMLREPVDFVCGLYERRREEIEGRGWSLADVYRELGGGGPRSSQLHDEFADFFNGQTRGILAPEIGQSKLEYWAGIPERGAALRDEALAILARQSEVEAAEESGRTDPLTRSLILAHNQIDAELHARFCGVVERRRSRRPTPAAHREPVAPPRTGAVCVLGAPRSGTSLTARILNILGVDLGREADLMPPAATNNRTGFWEHEGIANLNEDIFASLADPPPPYLQGWRWPPPLAEGWERDPSLDPHRRAAGSLLRQSFGDAPLWGWKDPRTCLTLPFWQELVAKMRYVICVRHPLDVAASLAARDRMPLEESLELWSRYMTSALTHTSEQSRLIVAYESYFPGWEEQAKRLATFLDLPLPSDAQKQAIATHVDATMWHHRGAEQSPDLPAECGGLYTALSQLAQA
jgi:Sulfotransferase family